MASLIIFLLSNWQKHPESLRGTLLVHTLLVGEQKGNFSISTTKNRSYSSVCTCVNLHGYEDITCCNVICNRKGLETTWVSTDKGQTTLCHSLTVEKKWVRTLCTDVEDFQGLLYRKETCSAHCHPWVTFRVKTRGGNQKMFLYLLIMLTFLKDILIKWRKVVTCKRAVSRL